MAESGATLLRRASSRSGWRSSSAGFIKRFRKPVVGASPACGALVAAFAAIWSSDALIRLAGLLPPNTRLIVVPFLVLTLFAAGLYTDLGHTSICGAPRLQWSAVAITIESWRVC
jgi:hypothetical protein